MESIAVMTVLFLVGWPYFTVSEFRCGFQWGTISRTKWLANARGMATKGFGIWVAMAAPIKTCGVSSIGRSNNILFSRKVPEK